MDRSSTDLIRPGRAVMTATRVERKSASCRLWVTKITVLRVRRQMSRSHSPMSTRVCSSRAPKGSSIKRIFVSIASARPIATRCFMPPESSRGYLPANPSIATELLGPLGLKGFAGKYPRELSGGMKQRVAIGRALAIDTKILLMDEPFGALDEQTRVLMGEWLLDIWRRTRKTVIFVTHSLHEALFLSTRVAVMTARPGRIKSVLELTMEYPRSMESPEMVALRAKLWSEIREESLRAMQ